MIFIARDSNLLRKDGSSSLLALFHARRVDAEVTEDLEYADVFFTGEGPNGSVNVGVERKALRDALSSMRNRRLSDHQIVGCLQTYDYSWLVIEGLFRPCPESGVLQEFKGKGQGWVDLVLGRTQRFMYSELQKFLFSVTLLSAYYGHPMYVWQTHNAKETVEFCINLQSWFTKPWDAHKSLSGVRAPDVHVPLLMRDRTDAEENEILRSRVAKCFSGLGDDRAKAAARHFGSPLEMAIAAVDRAELALSLNLNAFTKRWEDVDGIGKTTAAKVTKEWRNA